MDIKDILFFGNLRIRRQALQAAFDAVMDYHDRQHRTGMKLLTAVFDPETARELYEGLEDDPRDTTGLQLAEESLASSADIFAGAVILVFDDMLHRYASMMGVTKRRLRQGFGPMTNGVNLSTLIWAGGNNFRHATEWDQLPRPYPEYTQANKDQKRQLDSIYPLMRALALSDRVEGYVTRHVLVKLAGNVGTGAPSYAVVENLILDAAADMANANGCGQSFSEARARYFNDLEIKDATRFLQ